MARPRRFLSLAAPLDVASARIALFGYLLAAQAGAAVGVRFVDDIGDAPASFSALADDLAWLGISIAGEPLQTSARGDLYGEHVQRLVAAGHARVDADKTLLRVPSGQTVIDDAVKGAVVFDNRALGEITLVNSDGSVSGTLRDAVDDALLATSPVVRDDRQLEHSARGRLILDALALPSPRYAHVGALIPDTPETELPSIAQLRRAGFLPGPVIDHLALLGAALPGAQESSDWPQRIAHFSLERLGHGPAHFNEPRLRALNARALRTLTGDKLAARGDELGGVEDRPAAQGDDAIACRRPVGRRSRVDAGGERVLGHVEEDRGHFRYPRGEAGALEAAVADQEGSRDAEQGKLAAQARYRSRPEDQLRQCDRRAHRGTPLVIRGAQD